MTEKEIGACKDVMPVTRVETGIWYAGIHREPVIFYFWASSPFGNGAFFFALGCGWVIGHNKTLQPLRLQGPISGEAGI